MLFMQVNKSKCVHMRGSHTEMKRKQRKGFRGFSLETKRKERKKNKGEREKRRRCNGEEEGQL